MDKLDQIHDLLADLLLNELQAAKEANIPLAAADKAAIARFLKDNGRTQGRGKSEDTAEMERQLKEMQERRKAARANAVAEAQADLETLYGPGTLQ